MPMPMLIAGLLMVAVPMLIADLLVAAGTVLDADLLGGRRTCPQREDDDAKEFQGTWRCVSCEIGGRPSTRKGTTSFVSSRRIR